MLPPIDDYFRQFTYDPTPADGSARTATAWTAVGELVVTGRRIFVGDSWAIAADSIEVAVPPGTYVITAECVAYGSDGRVGRLRGQLPGRDFSARRRVGDFGVDVASAGVIDADALERWAAADEEGFEQWCDAFVQSRTEDYAPAGLFPCPGAGVAMVHCSTGFGDGAYDACTLHDGDEVVGFELVFIAPTQGYFEEYPGMDPEGDPA